MITVAYVGAEDEVAVFGLVFPRGVPVTVADPHACSKLRTHGEFEVRSDDAPQPAPVFDPPKRRGRPPKVPHAD